jgi:hypothetical protein
VNVDTVHDVKRGVLIVLGTAATVLGSIAVASPAVADSDCPYGTVPTRFPGVCVQGQGGSPAAAITVPVQGSSPANVTQAPGQLPTINGIPCNLEHANTCYALSQQP